MNEPEVIEDKEAIILKCPDCGKMRDAIAFGQKLPKSVAPDGFVKCECHLEKASPVFDAGTMLQALATMLGTPSVVERENGARDWVFTPPGSSLSPHTFTISAGDIPPFLSRRMLHELHKRQSQDARERRRKKIARRQKRAAFRRRRRGLA